MGVAMDMTPHCLVSLMMVAGCATTQGDAATPAPAPVAAEPVPTEDSDAPRPAGKVLLESEPLVIDGQSHAVYLDETGMIHVGAATIVTEVPAGPGDSDEAAYFWDKQARLSVASFTAEQPAVVLATPTSESEDPPNRYQVFLVDETGLTRIFDKVIGAYGVQPVRLPGDGTIRFTEDGWTACERLKYPKEAVMQEVVYRMDAQSGETVEAERTDTADSMICDQLAG